MGEVRGVIPNLTRLIFSSIRSGAEWATEMFVSYCELLVRTVVRTTVAIVIAAGLIHLSIWRDNNLLLLLGVAIGGGALFVFAIMWSPMYMGARLLAKLSDIAAEEIERISNIFFLLMVTLFYLTIDQGQRHPTLLGVFLGMMFLLFVLAILPGRGTTTTFFRKRFQLLVLLPVVAMTLLTVVPEAVMVRVTGGHWLEKFSQTVSTEVSFKVDDQDQIIDLTTNQPMVLFERVSPKGKSPGPIKGWTKDRRGNYHLWTWFDGQTNSTPSGQEIRPITFAKIDEIIGQAKREKEQNLPEEKKAVPDSVVPVKTDEEKLAEIEQQKEAAIVEAISKSSIAEQEKVNAKSRDLSNLVFELGIVTRAPNQQLKDVLEVRPAAAFIYKGIMFEPDKSSVFLNITDVQKTSDKNQYRLILQPKELYSGGIFFSILKQTDSFELIVQKSDSSQGVVVVGGDTFYSLASHGKKFQVRIGSALPPIVIRPAS